MIGVSLDSSALLSIDTLPEPFRGALKSMYQNEPQIGVDKLTHELDAVTRISITEGMWIYDLCCKLKPQNTLEIGMAYGFSSLYFLAALSKNKVGHHTAVDPFQHTSWRGIGLAKVEEVGMQMNLIDDLSSLAAADLHKENRRFEVIFIDGNHRFDDVIVDFTLFANLCQMNGYVILHDMWMRSIRTATRFIVNNRADFVKVDTAVSNIGVLHRVGTDVRPWTHFVPFPT